MRELSIYFLTRLHKLTVGAERDLKTNAAIPGREHSSINRYQKTARDARIHPIRPALMLIAWWQY